MHSQEFWSSIIEWGALSTNCLEPWWLRCNLNLLKTWLIMGQLTAAALFEDDPARWVIVLCNLKMLNELENGAVVPGPFILSLMCCDELQVIPSHFIFRSQLNLIYWTWVWKVGFDSPRIHSVYIQIECRNFNPFWCPMFGNQKWLKLKELGNGHNRRVRWEIKNNPNVN